MVAMFGIGIQELLILMAILMVNFLFIGGIVLLVVMLTRRKP